MAGEHDRWSGSDWSVVVHAHGVDVSGPSGSVIRIDTSEAGRLVVRRRWFRWVVERGGERILRLTGIAPADAAQLGVAIRRLAVARELAAAVGWHAEVQGAIALARSDRRWFTTEAADALLARRPPPGLAGRLAAAGALGLVAPEERAAVAFLDADLLAVVALANEEIAAAELRDGRAFFDSIESSPLTDEQARAVVCFDNRVQVLAAAGSGKTSVMVARAAYAVSRGFVAPERILLLAFNTAAAKELQERVDERFAAAGIDATGVRASTFHAFGLDVIGRATGAKPRLAPWVEQGNGVDAVLRIVDDLRDRSTGFRYRWDLYRLLFANVSVDSGASVPDGWDPASRVTGYRTLAGEVVKSEGERMVADFVFLNGVAYQYERPYAADTADAQHSQYRPDFYYADLDVWHEHWAIGRDGSPPAEFAGYAEEMEWKRDLHRRNGTRLIETTWADVVWGDGLERLGRELSELGADLDWNPDRAPVDRWAAPMSHQEMARLVRTYMTHVKSGSLTRRDLESRLGADMRRLHGYRTKLFLDLYWEIHDEWQRRLQAEGCVDFEDMLVQAADHLEAGRCDPGHELILVDEFQDASRARARLVRGLLQQPGRHLLAVGDDWQAINRFAGADLSVMTGFESWFGRGQQLSLTTTFRCPQTICDVASRFVVKNPRQFRKTMRSARPDGGAPVRVLPRPDAGRALAQVLEEVAARASAGELVPTRGDRVSVDVLGRYRWDRDLLPRRLPPNLNVTFRTVHGSKGLEADVVLLPNVSTGRHGFPSTIADDPVLDLAMPVPDAFPFAEERRLFYVALTRARREVVVITPQDTMSPFAVELLADPDVVVSDAGGRQVEVCPECGRGTLVARRGPYGRFHGCSTFPACRFTRNIA